MRTPTPRTAGYVEQAGRRAVLVRGNVADPQHCRDIIQTAVNELGGLDILVSNAAFQMSHDSLEEVSDEEWDRTIGTNISAMFYLCRAAIPHLKPGSSHHRQLIGELRHAVAAACSVRRHKAAIANFCASLAQMLGEKGIRVNSVAPGPIWTPLIPATMPPEKVEVRREHPTRQGWPAQGTGAGVCTARLR